MPSDPYITHSSSIYIYSHSHSVWFDNMKHLTLLASHKVSTKNPSWREGSPKFYHVSQEIIRNIGFDWIWTIGFEPPAEIFFCLCPFTAFQPIEHPSPEAISMTSASNQKLQENMACLKAPTSCFLKVANFSSIAICRRLVVSCRSTCWHQHVRNIWIRLKKPKAQRGG